MRFQYSIVLTVLSALALAPSAAAQVQIPDDAPRLSPAMPWSLDYAEHNCTARRVFEGDGAQVYLELAMFSPDSTLQMVVASDDLDVWMGRLKTTFIPDMQADDEHSTMPVTTETFGSGFVTMVTLMSSAQVQAYHTARDDGGVWTKDEIAMDRRESEIEGLLIENGFGKDIYLETGSMQPIMVAMRQCMDDLVESWGVDPEAYRNRISRPVSQNWESVVRKMQRRYPGIQRQRSEQALVRIRLMVSSEGYPTDCAVQSSMNEAAFDEMACNVLMENARFEPAIDADGMAMPSFWITSVRYTMDE